MAKLIYFSESMISTQSLLRYLSSSTIFFVSYFFYTLKFTKNPWQSISLAIFFISSSKHVSWAWAIMHEMLGMVSIAILHTSLTILNSRYNTLKSASMTFKCRGNLLSLLVIMNWSAVALSQAEYLQHISETLSINKTLFNFANLLAPSEYLPFSARFRLSIA